MRRRPLPEGLRTYHTTEKMLWLYIALNGEDEYSGGGLADELGSAKNVMRAAVIRLRDDGWLVEVRPPSGRRSAVYRAVSKPA